MRFYLLQIPYMASAAELRDGLSGRPLPGADPDRFHTMLEWMTVQVVHAEEVGFSGVCWTEQHFQAEGIEVNTNPVLYGAHMAAHTTRMAVGQLGIPLPCRNPLQVAEDLAVLDHMTGGRTFCGFSRSNTPRYASVLGQHVGVGAATSDKSAADERNRALLKECFQIIRKAWTEESFSYDGDVWKVPPADIPWRFPPTLDSGRGTRDGRLTEISVVPKPMQRPHPPLYSPFAFSMTTARFWAQEGVNLVSFVEDEEFLKTTMRVYAEEAASVGRAVPTGGGLAVGGHLLVQGTRSASEAYAERFRDLFAYAYDVTPYHVPLGRQIAGTGDDALRQIEHLRHELGVEEVFLWHHANCFDPDRELEAITEFGEKVIAKLGD